MVKSEATFRLSAALPEAARLPSTGEATLVTAVIVGSDLPPKCRDSDQKGLMTHVTTVLQQLVFVCLTELL